MNAPEWNISNLAAVVSGGLAAGIYTTNSPAAVKYVAEHSRANLVVVEDQHQVDKVQEVRGQLPHLRAVIQYSGQVVTEGVMHWEQLLDIGRQVGLG